MEDVAGHAAAEVAEIAYSGTSLEPFIQSVKLKVGGKDACESYIFEAPNPTISAKFEKPGPSSGNPFSAPRVEPFKAWGCTIIVLSWQNFFKGFVPEKFICVRGCGRATVVRNGWYSKLVRALGLHRPLFLLSQDYRCKDCHAKPDGKGGYGSTLYLAHSAELRNQLRSFIMDQLPISFTETGVPVERSLQDLIHFLAPEAIGFPRIARLVQELHVLAEKRRELVYYQYQGELKAKRTEEEAKRQTGIGRFFSSTGGGRVASSGVEQPVQTWAMGKRVPAWVAGPALLSSVFLQQAAANMPTYNRQMALVKGECVGVDHCHKLMRRVRGVEGQRVLEATLTMMTETGEVATSLWTHSTSLEVVRDNLRQVYERMASLGRAPRVLFCDWPEVMGPFFMDVWPGLEAYLMDILHAIMRVTKHVPEDHPFRGWLQSKLSEAIFVKNQADLVGIMKELEQKGKTLSDKAGKNALRRCRKAVPPPEVLLTRLEAVGDEASCKVNPLTTEPLLGPHAQRAFQGLLHQARLGLLSDPPNMEMYYSKPTRSANARPQYACKRVGSRLEGFHVHFQAILKNYNVSAELAWAVASTWLTGWNIRMRQANRGEPDHGPAFDLEILYRIGEHMEALGLAPAYRDVQFTVEETAETFGIQCTPAGFQEAAAAFQEGEFAPTQFPELAYLDACGDGPDFDAGSEPDNRSDAPPQGTPLPRGCEPPEPPEQPASVLRNGAQGQPVLPSSPAVPGCGAHHQPVVPPSLSVPAGSAHNQPVVPPSLSVPGGGEHHQPVVPLSLSVLAGGARNQPVVSPAPSVLAGGARNQPVVPAVQVGGAQHQPAVPPAPAVLGARAQHRTNLSRPAAISSGGLRNQPAIVSSPSVLNGGVRSQLGFASPLIGSDGGLRSQPGFASPPAVLSGGVQNQPAFASPPVVSSREVPSQPTLAPPQFVSGWGVRSQPAFAPALAVPGGGLRSEPAFAPASVDSGGGVRSQPAFAPASAVPGGGVRSQPAFAPASAVLGGGVRSQSAFAPPPAVSGGGSSSQPAFAPPPAVSSGRGRSQPNFASPPAVPGGGVRSQPAFAPPRAVPARGPHGEPILQPASGSRGGNGSLERPGVPGGGQRSQPASARNANSLHTGFPIEVGMEPRGTSDSGPFTPHFNAPPSRRSKLRSLPALHNFNLVHFKRPITTAGEHNLFLELYMKHATKGGTNYRAVLMEFNSIVARQLWGLSQGGHQQAIDSDLYFKDYRDITRYERQLVRSLLSREADNTSVALSSAIEHATSSPAHSTMTPRSSVFPPQTSGCGLGRGQGDGPSGVATEAPVEGYTGPLVVRPPGVESSRQKAGNQGGKGVGKKCRKCDPDGKLGIMRGAEHDCPYSKKNTCKRKRE